tara:strand:- start:5133 stop:6374 length:1242 start_codon:yes stop_codon:yes gene_type:complete
MELKFRNYQTEIINKSTNILKNGHSNCVYLAMEVRTGKTLTALGICSELKAKNVLFITKKKAITSIEHDFYLLNPPYYLEIINYESLHKIPQTNWDVVICDESHSLGAFPRPNKRAKQVKEIFRRSNPYVLFLSGTPTPESYSQMYHQIYGVKGNPFEKYKNFYAFAKVYVKVTQRKINSMMINDYTKGLKSIIEAVNPFKISYTQKSAGFKTQTEEKILYVELNNSTQKLIKRLKRDRVVEGEGEILLGDTGVKLMSKIHQLCSGTVKFESGNAMTVDYSKVNFIKKYFKDKKIAIFYKFTQEYKALKEIYGEDLTNDLEEFKSTDKCIALQIVAGREGVSLKEAQALVYYNIDFSATSYFQSRDRMTTKDRAYNKIYWIFSNKGIENDIYKTVVKKKDFTLNHFKRDLLDL